MFLYFVSLCGFVLRFYFYVACTYTGAFIFYAVSNTKKKRLLKIKINKVGMNASAHIMDHHGYVQYGAILKMKCCLLSQHFAGGLNAKLQHSPCSSWVVDGLVPAQCPHVHHVLQYLLHKCWNNILCASCVQQ